MGNVRCFDSFGTGFVSAYQKNIRFNLQNIRDGSITIPGKKFYTEIKNDQEDQNENSSHLYGYI